MKYLDRLESAIVDWLDGISNRMEDVDDELNHGAIGRARFKLTVGLGVFAIVAALVTLATGYTHRIFIAALGAVMVGIGLYGVWDNDYPSRAPE